MTDECKPKTNEGPVETGIRRFKETARQLYCSFRFAVIVHATPNEDRVIPSMSIYNDPFVNEVWIGRAHIEKERSLGATLCEERSVDIWMLPRGEGSARKVTVDYDGIRYLPLELHAMHDEVACEWVVLKNAKCSTPVDVERDHWPTVLQDR